MIHPPIYKKSPDIGLTVIKEKHTKDLTKVTWAELMEMKRREEDLLEKRNKILKRLPDKGKRARELYEKILIELKRRENVEETAEMFSKLNIASTAEKALNQLEWSGKINDKDILDAGDPLNDVLDSDDEAEMDPLRVIAQQTMHERRTKILPPEPLLITADDMKEIESFTIDNTDDSVRTQDCAVNADIVNFDISEKLKNIKTKLKLSSETPVATTEINDEQTTLEPHVLYLVNKTETNARATREHFKPYKTTISNTHDPAKERLHKKGKNWEITAASPPFLQHPGTKLLTLLDSVEVQTKYLEKMKEIQEKQAAERLAVKMHRLELRNKEIADIRLLKSTASFQNYRVPNIEGNYKYNELEELHDPLDEERPVGASYIVYE